jgi:hypothetical protein
VRIGQRLTPNGHLVEECRSGLQKYLRQGGEDMAMYCAAEICFHRGGEDGSGYTHVRACPPGWLGKSCV